MLYRELEEQYTYHVWANDRLFKHIKSIPEPVFHEELESIFPTLATVFVHMYFTESIWLEVMQGEAFQNIEEFVKRPELTDHFSGKSMEEIIDLYGQMERKYRKFLVKTDPDSELSIDHPKHGNIVIPVSDMIRHLINHGTYHRGNVAAMLRQLGHEGISTDYFVYLIEREYQGNQR
ncbi:DinB family protein [Sediminibacillus massiliensis]|uniref:DinB family protein n=1 Tax=Sediminibacillus massiliensis TaxID=1926277 RepID=UPI00098849B3|nr:DinB family protein [Sediminibacillus massiliensis]